MATTPTPNPTTSPTPAAAPTPPASEPTIEQLRDAAIAAQAPPVEPAAPTGAVPPPAAPPAAPEPYTISKTAEGVEVRLETGQVYKGATESDALTALAKAQVEASKRIRQLSTTPAEPQPATPATPPQPQETEEQRQAREWVMEQFSKSPEGKAILATIQATQQQNLAAAFMQRCPDFPNTEEASNKLVELAEQMNVPPTPEGLEMAHLYAVRHGVYQAVTPPAPAASARPTPPPMLSPSSPAASGELTDKDLQTMPLPQLRELALKGQR